MKRLGLLALFFTIAIPSAARAEIRVAATLEWLADHCRESGIYKVQSVEKKEHVTGSYKLSFALERELRGRPARTTSDAYYPGKHVHADRPSVQVGDEFLICFQHDVTGEVRPVQLINLTNPALSFPKFIAVADHAIRAELGKFLLVRHGGRLVALRVLKHVRHTTASGKTVPGAIVEYYLSTTGNFAKRKRSEVKVANDYEDQKFLYVHIPDLVIEWSVSDWFYAPDRIGETIRVAKSDWDAVDDVDFANSDLIWYRLLRQSHPPEPPLYKLLVEYRGEIKLPDDLYTVYAHLVTAVETGDQGAIQQYCLPQAVTFTTDARPRASREYGQDMNLPFLKRGFHKYILNLRKDSDDSYLIRTGSSYLFFVRTNGGDWKLYRYGDKPIE